MSRLPKTVPAPAKHLLDFTGDIEAPKGYDTIFGNNQGKLAKPLTMMTFGDVVDQQKSWTKRFGSSAAGRYQFMRATNQGLAKEFPSDINGATIYSRDLQDRMGYALLLRRGYAEFIAGKISRTEFGKRLAQEWASLPVLTDCQGAHRKIVRGQSYYAGDGLNKSLVKPGAVETTLDFVLYLAAAEQPDAPAVVTAPDPAPVVPAPTAPVATATPASVRGMAPIMAAIGVALAAAGSVLGGLPCQWFGVMCGG